MPPGELPASLVAGKPTPTVNTSGYGTNYQKNTPTSPEDSLIPFDSPTTRTSGTHSPLAEEPRSGRGLEPDPTSFRERSNARDRSRANGRPHNKSPGSSRVCQKCTEPLTGQFVRALGGTFHLECFKCEVGAAAFDTVPLETHAYSNHRIVEKLLRLNSFPWIQRTGAANFPCVRLTISED